jgi:Zn-dependent protease with chaperone function
MTTLQVRACPECAEQMPVDDRFVVWCGACGWNAEPPGGMARPAPGRVEALRLKLSRRHGEQLYAQMSSAEPPRPGRSAAHAAAYALSALVHLATLLLAAAGLWLIAAGWSAVVPALVGCALLGVAWLLRPRLGRLPDDVPVLRRDDAPALFGLIDEVAEELGAPRVDTVVVASGVNASIGRVGPRRRVVLTLGLGLWDVLSPQQRVALLGHELGHLVNGDSRHGFFVGSALRSLAGWFALLRPDSGLKNRGIWDLLFRVVMIPPAWAALMLLRGLEYLTLRASQQAEYLADALAARAGSTAAAAELMDTLLLGDTLESWLSNQRVAALTVRGAGRARQSADDVLWTELTAYAASIPVQERERRRRISGLHAHAQDATHPPTHLRREAVLRREPQDARVVLDAGRAAQTDAGLDAARKTLAREVLRA